MDVVLTLTQALANGLLIGAVYGLISVGLTLIFGVMDIINFAHGEFLMVGMFGAYFASDYFGIDPLIFAPVVGILAFLLGALTQKYLIEPILHAPQIAQVVVTLGIGVVLTNGAAALFGNNFLSVTTSYQVQTFNIFGIRLGATYTYAALYAAVIAILLALFLNKTDFGKAMRATAQNRYAAQLVGINPKLMFMVAFGIGIALVAMAGSVILPYTLVSPTVGQGYALIMFTVVVLGGLGSIKGALIAGLVVGVIQSLATMWLPTELQNLPVFIVFFLALIVVRGGLWEKIQRDANNRKHLKELQEV